jgi:AraC-like DNA-binding protein
MANRTAMFQEHTLTEVTRDGTIWPYIPIYGTPLHFHPQVEFLIMLRGSAQARIGHATHRVSAGQLVWQLPGIEHELLDISSDCDFRVVQVEPDVCAEVGQLFRNDARGLLNPAANGFSSWSRDLGWLVSGRPVVELKRTDLDKLRDYCELTCADERMLPAQSAAAIRGALESAWRATRDDHDDLRANSLVELACCLLLDQPSLERGAVCRALDVSESYLSRRFQAELGVSFLEQRARLRIAHFVSHVTRGERGYLDAALRAGFGSYTQLHRVFAQLVHVSPKVYFGGGHRNARSRQNKI